MSIAANVLVCSSRGRRSAWRMLMFGPRGNVQKIQRDCYLPGTSGGREPTTITLISSTDGWGGAIERSISPVLCRELDRCGQNRRLSTWDSVWSSLDWGMLGMQRVSFYGSSI